MSSPKFMVFKLKDLRIPILILLVVLALFIFLIVRGKTTQTFAPSDVHQDGKYIAGITLSDAQMDLVVEVKDHAITSVSLSGLDESSSVLYKDLVNGIDYVNTYVTSTQSLELPTNADTSSATLMLMDAVKIALSEDETASITTTYEKMDLTASKDIATNELEEDIFVDEFEEDAQLEEEKVADANPEADHLEVDAQDPDIQ